MRPAIALFLLSTLTLGACADDRLTALNQGPAAPTGVDAPDDVDGLIVGHRLMEAGEYELALREYLRAGAEQGLTADVLSSLGSANLRLGRLGQAERLLRRAIEEDQTFAAAWNNLGVVLMEKGEVGEASRVFQTAFALDSGESAEIRENLRSALAQVQNPAYTAEKRPQYDLVRRGRGEYQLLGNT